MKTAVVIGASGLVGSLLTKQLLQSSHYGKVVLLNRKASGLSHAKLQEKQIDFDAPDLTDVQADDVYCAIGTTLKKAGSKEAQYKIDCLYPARLAGLLLKQGATRFLLVSSIGANAQSGNFYLRTKGELEQQLMALKFPSLVIVRPSFILGDREEFRAGEKIGIVLMKVFSPLLLGGLKKYRGVEATAIAACLIQQAVSGQNGTLILESNQIR